MKQPVLKRAVFFIGGYEPKTPEAFFSGLSRQVSRFDALWGYSSDVSPVEVTQDNDSGVVTISTRATEENWSTSTDFNFLSLNRIVLGDFARPMPIRLFYYIRSFTDFVISGAAFHFFFKAWRFGLYFVYPFLVLTFFALVGYLVAQLTLQWFGLASGLVGVLIFILALSVAGERWSTNHLMDLWSFSLDFIRGRRADADIILQRFAETVIARTAAGGYDEVILIGHSTGGLLMIDVAARCLSIDKKFAGSARKVALLTLGSTALKAGYHPAGTNFRKSVEQLINDDKLVWVEIQCLTDAINFYKTDPVAEMGLDPKANRAFPIVRTIKVRDMLQPDTYARIKRNFFRVHYQYVCANTKPYWYDFFQICCGPNFLAERVESRIVGGLQTEKATMV
ncbi:lipase (plasmid) [Rhizobium sp. 32-5/1]|uniref:lipase n=1 Tax=Rhizobium sp. 32-5/1 TaxID=3019602 RepID=UPI00240E94D8|nr:lipase [Rhizobium sp. 32-5/1]WEZ86083.1 lipase [Rhizobium sp. 32-5/1]